MNSARIELWVEPRRGSPAVNPVMRSLIRELIALGCPVRVRAPELDAPYPHAPRDCDVVLLKSATTLALALAADAEAAGTQVLNGAEASLRVADKAETVSRLAAAGLPVPPTHLTTTGIVPSATKLPGPMVSKPVLGWHGEGVRYHPRDGAAVASPARGRYLADDGSRLVQARIGDNEPDVKVYVAGRQVFAARKAFAAGSYESNDVTPTELDRAATDVVLAVGPALGLTVYGVDLRIHDDRPVIVDVNAFPGFRGLPSAVPALLDTIRARLFNESQVAS